MRVWASLLSCLLIQVLENEIPVVLLEVVQPHPQVLLERVREAQAITLHFVEAPHVLRRFPPSIRIQEKRYRELEERIIEDGPIDRLEDLLRKVLPSVYGDRVSKPPSTPR